MNNEKLTEEFMKMVASIARVEGYTSCIPKLKTDCDVMFMHVHDNTQCRKIMEPLVKDINENTKFRKNSVKVIWISITAAASGISALILSLIGLKQ